jgi:glycosyltransferase involved in cell wall biosynthesis
MKVDPAKYVPPSGVEMIILDGGPVTSSMRYWLLLPYWQMRLHGKITAWRPDVLLPQVFPANWWGWFYRYLHQSPRVVWVCQEPSAFIHSRAWIAALVPFWKRYLAVVLRPLLSMVDLSLSRYCDAVAANSRYTAGQVESVYGVTPDAIAYPAIDVSVFYPGGAEGRTGIVTVAKLTRFKRIDFLLRVFALVLQKCPGLTYHIVGRGEELEALKSLAEELGIAAQVSFHSSLDNAGLAELHRRSLLFLHGSVEEPFGMAPLEAIACGTPAVAHRSGGPKEFISDGCGRLIDSLSEETWCEEICRFLELLGSDRAYFERVAEGARDFTWGKTLLPIVTLVGSDERLRGE